MNNLEIVGQKIIGIELSDPKKLSERLHEAVKVCKEEVEPKSVLIHQVIKASETEYVVILYVVE